jgi:hypothetical protein
LNNKIALIGIIGILVLVVAVSGCTSTNTSSNKTYSANGVTFIYPGNWTEQNLTSLQTTIGSTGTALAVVGDGSGNKFGVAKRNIGSNERVSSLSEWASGYNSSMQSQGSTYVSEKSLTVNGVDAYQMTFQDSGSYITDIFFVKNGTGYLVVHQSPNNDQQTLEQLLKNLQIT